MRSLRATIGVIVFALAALPGSVFAQTTWTGANSASWADPGNWSAGVPTAGVTALFNGPSSNTFVDLGGVANPVGTISFDTANASSYTFSGNFGDAFVFDAAGGVSATATVTAGQTFTGEIDNLGALNITNNGTGLLTFNGPFALASGGTADLLTVGGAGNVTITSSLGTNFTGLTKTGAGTLTFSTGNTYAGPTTVNGGTLAFSDVGQLGDATQATNTIALSGGGVLKYSGSAADLGVNRAISLGSGGGTIETGASNLTVSGIISGSDTLTKGLATGGGAGALILTGANTGFTGNILLNSGSIQVGANDALGSAGSVTIQGSASGVVLNGVVTNAGKTLIANRGGTILTSTASSTWSGPIVFGANAAMTISVPNPNVGETLTVGGTITSSTNYTSTLAIRGTNGSSASSFIVTNGTITLPNATVSKTDPDTWIINSTGNSWTNTTLAVGTIQIGANDALPTNVALTVGQTTSSATLDLKGFDQTIGSLILAGTANDKITNTNSSKVSHFTVNNTANNTYSSAIVGNIALIKYGTGTLTLNPSVAANANTYTGGTTDEEGTLLINNTTGSGTGTGLVSIVGTGTLGSGGTLGGTGSISGGVAVGSTATATQGGALAPGAALGSVGKLTLTGGTSAFNPLGTYVFDYNASATGTADTTSSDFLSGTGSSTKLNLANLGTAAGQQFNVVLEAVNVPAGLPSAPVTYTLATFAGGVTAPAGIIGTDLTPYFTFSGAYQGTPTATLNGTSVQVTFTPVPEPSSAVLLLGVAAAAAGTLRGSRRRQRSAAR